MGGISSAEAIEQSQHFGLDIVAKYYLVALIRIELCEQSLPFDYEAYQQVEKIVSELSGNNLDVFLTKKDLEELVLLIKGDHLEQLVQEGDFLAELIKKDVEKQTSCNAFIEIGSPQDRLGNIHHSFAEALAKSIATGATPIRSQADTEGVRLVNMNHEAIENYLKFGSIQAFDPFFSTTIQPVSEIALQSYLIKHYLFVDIILTVTQFISDMGGNMDQLASDIHEIEKTLDNIQHLDQIKTEMRHLFVTAITIRNSRANHERNLILQQAKAYLDEHYADSELKMGKIARMFNISPSYFSTIFHKEFGQTFRDYLSKVRLNHAKELLSTSNLKCSEIAYQCGFTDSHYFSYVFKKKTGLTPLQFRAKTQNVIK